VELGLVAQRNIGAKTTGADGRVDFDPGLSRGKGGSSPGWSPRSPATRLLSLAQNAFDLSDRGVAGRDPPAGLDAFLYPSAASIDRARPCSPRRFCATPRS
jgi:hypothetical protein